MNSIQPIDAEREDLSTHVDLCAQRYAELDNRVGRIETKLDGIEAKIDGFKADIVKIFVGSAASIIVAIIGAISVYLQVK